MNEAKKGFYVRCGLESLAGWWQKKVHLYEIRRKEQDLG